MLRKPTTDGGLNTCLYYFDSYTISGYWPVLNSHSSYLFIRLIFLASFVSPLYPVACRLPVLLFTRITIHPYYYSLPALRITIPSSSVTYYYYPDPHSWPLLDPVALARYSSPVCRLVSGVFF